MRLRIQSKIRKALRIFGIRGVEPARLPALVRNRSADPRLRVLAASLLAFDKRQRDPFGPLYAQMLDCGAEAALEVSNALPLITGPRPRAEVAALEALLRSSPDATLRIALLQAIRGIPGRQSRQILIETMEREGEPLEIRNTAADQLTWLKPRRDTIRAYQRCLSHPNPSVRFWAVFGLGTSTERSSYDEMVTGALHPLTADPGEERGYWSVGDEARAMLAYRDAEIRAEVQRECAAILAGPEENSAKWRWARFYYQDGPGHTASRSVTYHGIRWFRS